MTIIIRQVLMPPMIHGHPGLGTADPFYPHGGRLFIPEKMEFNEDNGVDEFEYELITSMSLPIGAASWAPETRTWMLENDPAWPTSMRPAFVRNSLQCH